MELFLELFFTAVFAVLFSFLIAKLVSLAMNGDSTRDSTRDSQSKHTETDDREISGDSGPDEAVIMEELQFYEKLQVEELRSEKVTEIIEEVTETVEQFVGESDKDDAIIESARRESPSESAEEVEVIGTSSSVEEGRVIENAAGGLVVGVENASAELPKEDKDVVVGESIEVAKCEEVAAEEVVVEEEGKGAVEIDVEDDDWEGIERSEVGKVFAEAVKLVECGGEKDGRFGGEAEMELYGLHKVATEGPCREQAPMALKLSARAKCDGGHWLRCARNAWQKLGNMNPEAAMEQYVALVSDRVPEWNEGKPTGDEKPGLSEAENQKVVPPECLLLFVSQGDEKPGLSEAENQKVVPPDVTVFPPHGPTILDARNPELEGAGKSDLTGGSNLDSRP